MARPLGSAAKYCPVEILKSECHVVFTTNSHSIIRTCDGASAPALAKRFKVDALKLVAFLGELQHRHPARVRTENQVVGRGAGEPEGHHGPDQPKALHVAQGLHLVYGLWFMV
jgi:hypothetical protein